MARDNKFSGFSALRRFAQEEAGKRAAEETVPEERCDLCGAPIPPDPDHRHLMEVATREISCVCRPCSILFDSEAASEGRYRVVPDRILDLEDFEMSDALWESLRVPVDMAFFFYNTPAAKVVAYYPSPMGPTESLLELEAWEELETQQSGAKGHGAGRGGATGQPGTGCERTIPGADGRVLQAGRCDPDSLEGLQRRARSLGRHNPILRRPQAPLTQGD